MDEDSVDEAEACEAQIECFYEEIGLLSKKNPTDAVSKFKLKFINGAIEAANEILGDSHHPLVGFTTFDEDACPSTSDVVVVLAQYLRSLDRFRRDNCEVSEYEYRWIGTTRKARKPRFVPQTD